MPNFSRSPTIEEVISKNSRNTYPIEWETEDIIHPEASKFVHDFIRTFGHIHPIVQPKNGKKYSNVKKRFKIGENKSVLLTEREENLATIFANAPQEKMYISYLRAGYSPRAVLKRNTNLQMLKKELTSLFKKTKTPDVTAYSNYIRQYGSEELLIDATWVLNEQINLYEEVKRDKHYNHAIRLLDQISNHIDVDAKASSRMVIEDKVDYAAILTAAEQRSKQKSLEASKKFGEIIEGEMVALENALSDDSSDDKRLQ